MRRFRECLRQYRLILAVGLLIGCGVPSSPSANQAYPAPSLPMPDRAYPLAPSSPYPVQQTPTQYVLAETSTILMPPPQLGLVVDADMQVLDVAVGSPAEVAGIQPGDRLEALDGIALISNIQNAKQHIYAAQPNQAMRLALRRGTASLEVIVVPAPAHPLNRPTLEPGRSVPTATPVLSPNDYL